MFHLCDCYFLCRNIPPSKCWHTILSAQWFFFFFWKIDILNSFIIVFIFSLNSLHEVYIGITNCKCLFSQMSILKMLMFWVNHPPPSFFFFFLHYAITVRSRKYGKVYFGLLVIAKKYRNYFLSVKEKTAKITL